jgi:hypothetical protein
MVLTMSDGKTEYFEVWLNHQIDLARRKFKDEWTTIDRKAAAEGWYRSGRRIKVSIRVIADIFRTLTAEAYKRAADSAVAEKLQQIATHDLFDLFNELVAKVPTLVQSTAHVSPRLEQAVAKLIAPIRSDLEASARLAQLSIRSRDAAKAGTRPKGGRLSKAISLAIDEIWNGKIPVGLAAKDRDRMIKENLATQKATKSSSDTALTKAIQRVISSRARATDDN